MPLEYYCKTYEYDMSVLKRIGQGMLNPVYGEPLKKKVNHENNILLKIMKKMKQKKIIRFRSKSI